MLSQTLAYRYHVDIGAGEERASHARACLDSSWTGAQWFSLLNPGELMQKLDLSHEWVQIGSSEQVTRTRRFEQDVSATLWMLFVVDLHHGLLHGTFLGM